MNLEGRAPANYFNTLGIAAFVLRYRLGPQYHHPIELGDAQRAIRTVRSRAREWHIAADRIGIMGFSAGGHLRVHARRRISTPATPSAADPIDRVSSRPDFAVLGYPVISFTEPWTHQGSKTNLLGEHPDPALARSLSSETQVTRHDAADVHLPDQRRHDACRPRTRSAYYLALRKAGVPAEMHMFKDGAHGTGLGQQDPALVGMADAARELAARQRVLEVDAPRSAPA